MKTRIFGIVIIAFLAMWAIPALKPSLKTASAMQSQSYRLIAPDLVAQGEAFTARVVEVTDRGEAPLGEGDQIVFQERLLPVGSDGRITFPTFENRIGNLFLGIRVVCATGEMSASTIWHHVEVIPVRADAPTRIARAFELVPLRIEGQGLTALHRAALIGPDGRQFDLNQPVGSSLQLIYTEPAYLPEGVYRLAAWDALGNQYGAPNVSEKPGLELRLTPAPERSKVTITVRSKIEGKKSIWLSGPGQFEKRLLEVAPNEPAEVQFIPQQGENYTPDVRVLNPEEIPPLPELPRVDTKLEPVQTRYNALRNATEVIASAPVMDEQGNPAAKVKVDLALAHPAGVEYARVTTDERGTALFRHALPGSIADASLSAHVYRVLGRLWKRPDEKAASEAQPLIKISGYKFEDANGNGVWDGNPHTREATPGGEKGLQGWQITLTGFESQVIATDETGRFEFTVRVPGPYILSHQPRDGWVATTLTSVTVNPRVGVTVSDTFFGSQQLPTTNDRCAIKTELKPGPGIEAEVIAPKEVGTAKTRQVIPLIVRATDEDQLLQTCICASSGRTSSKLIDLVDSVTYQWSIEDVDWEPKAIPLPPPFKTEEISKLKVIKKLYELSVIANFEGPATLYRPPNLEVGQSLTLTIKVQIKDQNKNDKAANVRFIVTVKREDDCKYTHTVSVKTETHKGERLEITPSDCECPPQEEGRRQPAERHNGQNKGLES
ncbi:MAG: hypothetical protein L0312_20545 [Acidobacteria bacterium]|nr:hypothetical protein [Acidobacteriota bacterium]